MDKVLIIIDKPIQQNINFKKFKYVITYEDMFHSLNISLNKKKIIPLDIISGRDNRLCDHLSSILCDKTFNIHYSKKFINCFNHIFSKNFGLSILKQNLTLKFINIFKVTILVRKLKKHFNLHNFEIIVNSSNINYGFYEKIYKKYTRLTEYKINKQQLTFFSFINFLKNLYGFLNLLILPEKILLINFSNWLFSNTSNKKKFSNCFILSENQYLDSSLISPLSFIKNIDKDAHDSIFVIENSKNNKWIKTFLNLKGINIVFLDLKKNKLYLSFYNVLKIFISLFKFRFILLIKFYYLFQNSFLIYKNINRKVLWDFILINYNFKFSFRSMQPGYLIDNFFFQNHNVKTYFIYYSNHGQILRKKINVKKSEYFQYSYLNFYGLISSNYSIKWFANQQNNFKNFINIGVFNTHTIFSKITNKKLLRKNLNIPNDLKVISFFDNSIGNNGMISLNAYLSFLNSMIIASNIENYKLIFKSKKTLNQLLAIKNKLLQKILKQVTNNHNIIYANNLNVSVEEIISISDLVISLPYSSIGYESYAANKKTLILDYDNNYNENHIFFNKAKIPKINNLIDFENNVTDIINSDINFLITNKALYFDKIFDIENSTNLNLIKTHL